MERDVRNFCICWLILPAIAGVLIGWLGVDNLLPAWIHRLAGLFVNGMFALSYVTCIAALAFAATCLIFPSR